MCDVLFVFIFDSGPSFFDPPWLSRIKKDCGDNWRLKVSNLKKVFKGILDYYNDVSINIFFQYKHNTTKIAGRIDITNKTTLCFDLNFY